MQDNIIPFRRRDERAAETPAPRHDEPAPEEFQVLIVAKAPPSSHS
jgi:hypothetical protein